MMENKETCKWKCLPETEQFGLFYFKTSCRIGMKFSLLIGHKEMKYCHNCGKEIEEVQQNETNEKISF